MSVLRHRPLTCYLLLCAIAALWIDLSRMHLGQNSDSLVPVLVSLQHWTPFYWEQSRFGMLVPLLATPLEQPLVNLLVQNGVMIFAGLAAIGLLARFFVCSSHWFAVACLSCACFLVFPAEPLRCEYLIAQPYGVSFSLGLGALLILDRKHDWWCNCVALAMLLTASWVNLAIGPTLVLIVMARWCGQRLSWRRVPARLVVLLIAATLFGAALERWATFRDAQVTSVVSIGRSLQSSRLLVANALHQGGPAFRNAMIALSTTTALGVIVAGRRRRAMALTACGSCALAAILLVLLVGANRWTALNLCQPRYICIAVLTLQTGLIAAVLIAIRARRAYAATLTVVAAVGFTYGAPSLATAQSALEECLNAAAGADIDADCTHIAGDYWRVWPAVFRTNWQRHEHGNAPPVWGVTFRSLPSERLWSSHGDAYCLVMLGHDVHAERLLRRHFSFAQLGDSSRISKSQ